MNRSQEPTTNNNHMIKTKFKCIEITNYPQWDETLKGYKPGGGTRVKLQVVTSGTKEDNEFNLFTPSGEITMSVDNPATKDYIQPGKKYYVWFEECPDQKG